MSRKI